METAAAQHRMLHRLCFPKQVINSHEALRITRQELGVMPYQPLGEKKKPKKDLKGISSSCTASGRVREGAVMNLGELPPRAASSHLWHHVLLPELPAPTSINWNDPRSG